MIERCTIDRRSLLIKFKDIDTPEAAARLHSAYMQVPLEETAPLPDGQFYVFDLIGSQVVTEDGRDIGRVRDILPMPANDVIVIDSPQGEVLIPIIEDVVIDIDAGDQRVVIRPMPGLLP
jgi:16S rRNA processing protein RimM